MSMLDLEIITPERVVVHEEVDTVEAMGALGEFGILPGHLPFLTVLEPGEIRYMKGGQTSYLAASEGFGEIVDDKVTFLVSAAEFAEDIGVERARIAVEEAEASLKDAAMDTPEYKVQEQALKRAQVRLQVASRKG